MQNLSNAPVSSSMNLGTVQPSEATTQAWIRQWVNERRRGLHQAKVPTTGKDLAVLMPPTLEMFMTAAKNQASIRKSLAAGNSSMHGTEIDHIARHWSHRYTNDFQGYLTYLNDFHQRAGSDPFGYSNALKEFDAAMAKMPSPTLLEETRRGHTAIFGGSDSGKSELIKALVYHYVKNPTGAVVLIDPHGGDMAKQIARWPELHQGNRLVWISGRYRDQVASFNPLDGANYAPDEFGLVSVFLAEAFSEGIDGAENTPRMNTMAQCCIRVLLEHPGATLVDLKNFLQGPKHAKGKEWFRRGCSHSNPHVAAYFQDDFGGEYLAVTRDALRIRINNYLLLDGFERMFCRPSTFNFFECIERRAVMLIDLSSCPVHARGAAGRLLLGMLAGLGLRRLAKHAQDVTPVQVFLDEASDILGSAATTIIKETRKAKIYFTFSQQVAGEKQSNDARAIISGSTAVKFAGGGVSRDVLRHDIGLPADADHKTERGVFWVKWGAKAAAVRLNVRSDLSDEKHCVPLAHWPHIEAWQHKVFYRPVLKSDTRAASTPRAADDDLMMPLEPD